MRDRLDPLYPIRPLRIRLDVVFAGPFQARYTRVEKLGQHFFGR